MPGHAEGSKKRKAGDCTIPNIPDSELTEEQYCKAVRKTLEEIVSRYREGRASKVDVQTTVVAYIGGVSEAGLYDFSGRNELKPWFEQLESDTRRLERAKQRGKELGKSRKDDDDVSGGEETVDEEEDGDDHEESVKPGVKRKREETPNSNSSLSEYESGGDDKPKSKPPRKHHHARESNDGDVPDDNLFGWAAAAVVQEVVLSAEHKKIRDAVENHRRDVKYTLHNLLHTGLAPVFPEALWKKILLDQVVDFDEINAFFFSTKLDLDPTPVSTVESALHKALGRSAEKKTVSSSVVGRTNSEPGESTSTTSSRPKSKIPMPESLRTTSPLAKLSGRTQPSSSISTTPPRSRNSSELSSTETAFGTMILEAQVGAQNLREQNWQRSESERSATTGTRGSASVALVPDAMSAAPAKDRTSSPCVNRKAAESSTSSSFVASLWHAARHFASGGGEDEEIEDIEESRVEDEKESGFGSFLPHYLRGFGWRNAAPQGSRTAWFTEVDEPLLHPPFPRFHSDQYRSFRERSSHTSESSVRRLRRSNIENRVMAMGRHESIERFSRNVGQRVGKDPVNSVRPTPTSRHVQHAQYCCSQTSLRRSPPCREPICRRILSKQHGRQVSNEGRMFGLSSRFHPVTVDVLQLASWLEGGTSVYPGAPDTRATSICVIKAGLATWQHTRVPAST